MFIVQCSMVISWAVDRFIKIVKPQPSLGE